MREQIEEIAELKAEISARDEQIYQLRDHIACNRAQVENSKADLEIEKLKGIAERKGLEVGFDVQLQKLKNDMDVQKKAGESLAQKLKLAGEEVRSKDEFIQRCIMGKRLGPDDKFRLADFFKEYQEAFPLGSFKAKLDNDAREIQRLERANVELLMELSVFKARSGPSSCDVLTTASSE